MGQDYNRFRDRSFPLEKATALMPSTTESIWTSPGRASDALEVYLLGRVDFDAALFLQERMVSELQQRNDRYGVLLLCEHPPMVSIGRDGTLADLIAEPEEFAAREMPIHRVSRGGGTLVHAPGQIAAYPILPLDRLGLGIAEFQQRLTAAVIATAGEQQVVASPTQEPPGTECRCGQFGWIGSAVQTWTSWHGLFLNVNPVLDLMRLVRSTSNSGRIASLSQQRMLPIPMHRVRESLIRHLAEQFGYEDMHPFTGHPLLSRTQRRVVEYV